MLVLLEKGRPSMAEGTRKQHTQMRGGKPTKVWVKKVGKKWVYDGMVDPKNKGSHVGERSVVRKKAAKGIEWVVTEIPSYDFLKQEYLKEIKTSYPIMPAELSEHLSKKTNGVVTSWETLQTATLREGDGTQAKRRGLDISLQDAFGPHYQKVFYTNGTAHKAFIEGQDFMNDNARLRALSNPMYDGKMDLRYLYEEDNGIKVTMYTNIGPIPGVRVGYEQLDVFLDAWQKDPRMKAKMKRDIKKSTKYKKWAVAGDPEMKSAVDKLIKSTGLSIETDSSRASRRKTQLKKEYIEKIADTFNTLKVGFDLTKYTPPDGRALKIRVTGASGHASGFYHDSDASINISPSMPGTISHEVGHYFWSREKAMQKEFVQWVHDCGLETKIGEATSGKLNPAQRENYINGVMNANMKRVLTGFTDPSLDDSVGDKDSLSKPARIGLTNLSNMFRLKMIKAGKPKILDDGLYSNPLGWLASFNKGDLVAMAESTIASYPEFAGQKPDDIANSLIALQNGVEQLSGVPKKILNQLFGQVLATADVENTDSLSAYYKRKEDYFKEPTEVFARTFRNYVAMKDGHQIFNTSNDQDKAYPRNIRKTHPHGWGFPEVDPSVDMIKFDNNRLERILKKYIGENVMKAMVDNISKSKYSDLATQLKEEGLYRDGMEIDFDSDELANGIKIEMEHTTDEAVAAEIAKDHLVEDDKYYTHLIEMEKETEKAQKDGTPRDGTGPHGIGKGPGKGQGCLAKGDEEDDDEEVSERDAEYEKEQRAEEAKDAHAKAPPLLKSKIVFVLEKAKKMPIGTESKGRKKVADGKWVGIHDSDPRERQMDAIMDGAARRNLSSVPVGVRRTIEIFLDRRKNQSDVSMKPSPQIIQRLIYAAEQASSVTVRKGPDGGKHIDTDAGTITVKTGKNNKQYVSYNSSTARVASTLTPKELTQYESISATFEKAKPYPNGTIRKHGGRTMVKKDGGWVPAEAGEASETPEAKDSKSRKPVKAKTGSTPKNTITGTPAMMTALVKIGGGKAPFLDDLTGETRKLYNSMTKAGLIRWVHLAEEEYKAELTDSGRKAVDSGQALTVKNKRAKKVKMKKKG